MKVDVQVFNGITPTSETTHTFSSAIYTVEPFKITRSQTGSYGRARSRYYYQAHFYGFDDMIDVFGDSASDVECRENINRKINPKFNPKKLDWVGNVAIVNK